MTDKTADKKDKKKPDAGKGVEINDKVVVDFEPVFNEKRVKDEKEPTFDDDEHLDESMSNIREDVAFILDYNLELDEEVQSIIDEYITEVSQLDEVLSLSQRVKKRSVMRRYRSRINISRKRSMRRRATTKTLQRRARRTAILNVKKKYSTKKKGPASYAERGRLERIVKQRKGLVNNSSRKLVRVKRQQERMRLSGRR